MKYFKYQNYIEIENLKKKTGFENLSLEEQKRYKKNKRIEKLSGILYLIIFIVLLYIIFYFSKYMENNIFKAFSIIVLIILAFILPALIFSFILNAIGYPYQPYVKGKLKREDIPNVTKSLKSYYGISDDYIVTKCYASSNQQFVNQDVCIFRYQDKIRITLDFNHTTIDAGCYELDYQEIHCDKIVDNGLEKAMIKVNDVELILGKRTRYYINRCLALAKCPCCGHSTFKGIKRGYFYICPVCFWEDDPNQEKNPYSTNGANKRMNLIQARKNYKEFGACEKEVIKFCRPPKNDE